MGKEFIDPQFEREANIEEELREPPQFRVLLHNDDYTTMEFVVKVLILVFDKTESEATQVMLHVHNEGVGTCGIYTAELAETKVSLVHQMARKNGFPLKCTMEEV